MSALAPLIAAARQAPGDGLLQFRLGLALHAAKHWAAALEALETAARLLPDRADIRLSIGNALQALGRTAEARTAFVGALRLRPDWAEAYFNLGNALRDEGRFDLAAVAYGRAGTLKPDYIEARVNHADLHYVQGRSDEALALHRATVAAFPNSADARFNLGMTLLARGDYSEGFAEYEWRTARPGGGDPLVVMAEPEWRGEPLAGRRILLHAEQGMGDLLQFIRFVPRLADQGAAVFLAAYGGLARLVRPLSGLAGLVEPGATPPPVDTHAMIMSVPHRLGLDRPDDFAMPAPYLAADPAETAEWRRRFADLPGRKVGLAWAGNPEHSRDRERSISPGLLEPLLRVPGVSFVSLQQGVGADAVPVAPELRPHVAGPFRDFAETAAAMAALDLVITVDTSIAHLAGALGRPAWVLLPLAPDWRWLLDGDRSAWYPSLRLYRQRRLGDWPDVVARVAAQLASLVGDPGERPKPQNWPGAIFSASGLSVFST